jgi:hypothetical protein
LLGAVHDHHLVCIHVEAPGGEVARHARPLVPAPSVRLVAQQGFEVAGSGELAQACSQQLGLARQRRIVEVQIHHVKRCGLLVDALVTGKRCLPDKGATASLTADQSHGLELRIDTGGRDERQAFLGSQSSVSGQARARRQAP